MMDLHQLKVFVSVYKNMSFSRASEELNLSQPTISDHIKNLEEGLNSRLFDRLGRSIAPTEEAVLLYAKAVELIEKFETLKSELRLSREDTSGELSIGASSVPGTYFIPKAIRGFKEIYPDTSFRLTVKDSKTIMTMVAEQELPMGIVADMIEKKSLNFVPFMEDEMILACKDSANDFAFGRETLHEMPFILREEGSGTRKAMEHYFLSNGIVASQMKVVASFDSNGPVKEAVKAGLGVSVLPRMAVEEELGSGLLKEIGLNGYKIMSSLYIVTHRKRTLSHATRLFLEYLMSLSPAGALHRETLMAQLTAQP